MEEMGLMRTRIGWLALLLTAGVALAPTNVRGQESPRPDPVWPVPLGDPGRSGFYTAAEFVYFRQTNPLKSQIIAIRGLLDFDGSITADLFGQEVFPIGSPPVILPATAMPGSFIGSGNVALNAEQAAGPQTYQPGFRLTAGWRFEDRSAIEFSWMSLTEAKFSAVASIVPGNLNPGPNLADSFLFAPVFNFPNEFAGPPNKVGLGNPLAAFGIWNAANTMSISFTQRYSQYDITGRIPVFETDYCRCYGLIGPRYVSMWENFGWRTVSQDFTGAGGQDDVAIYYNIVSNQMYGVDAGIGSEWFLGHGFAATIEGRAAALIDFVHEIAKYQRGDFAIGHKRARRDYKAVPEGEARVALYWYPIEGVEIRVGFDIMGFLNTVSSPHPVVFNYGSLDPTYQQTSRLLDGFFAGIGFIF
jgi:hypothetical protein